MANAESASNNANTPFHPEASAIAPKPYALIVLPTYAEPFKIPAILPESYFSRNSIGATLVNALFTECEKSDTHPNNATVAAPATAPVLPPIVEYLRNMSPVWKDLVSGKRQFTL